MKRNSVLLFISLIYSLHAVCQCPPSGLKIQTPACNQPKNLSVKNITCDSLTVQWQGNQSGSYVVTFRGRDSLNRQIFSKQASEYQCSVNGYCSATVGVGEGITVSWNVVAICQINGTKFYSNITEGKEVSVPYCYASADKSIESKPSLRGLSVFPNPTLGYLTVDYSNKSSGEAAFTVIDIAGKTVFQQSYTVTQGGNQYTLDLRNLLPGIYILSISNGKEISHTKFTILKK